MTEENKRGPNDLEEKIDMLTKQVKFLQGKCKQAGAAIINLEHALNKKSEECDNLEILLKGRSDDNKN
tara:strand:- start:583 stop:786 length:204 start_codon:yes stop_codon:yes gene_type:complete